MASRVPRASARSRVSAGRQPDTRPRCGRAASEPPDDRSALLAAVPAVEALAGLLAQLALGDHAAQQIRRAEAIAELAGEVVGDVEADVEADQIGELERAHRVAVAELHGGVD